MVAVDTNILVRLLTGDHRQQHAKALALFRAHEVFIPDTVILECEWVLRYAYGFTPAAICDAFRRLFGLPNVHIDAPARVVQAMQWHEQGLDFADALHLSRCQQIGQLFTFDAKFIRNAKGLSECRVTRP